jgi:signal transduction histidine kinase
MKESVLKISEPNLKTILTELIDNAFKFSSPGNEVKISGSCSENNFMLSILNHGHGLTDEQIAFLGGYFQADRMLYEQPGLGLGIPTAKKIAEFHSGKFKIESIPGKETLITLILPLSEII